MVLDIVKADAEVLLRARPGSSKSVLRTICVDIQRFNRDLYDLAHNMAETMFASHGIGLAAPQVGVGLNMFVMRVNPQDPDSKEVEVLINPKATLVGETYQDVEGCLSILNLLGRVERFKEIAFTSVDVEGRPKTGYFSGLAARCFQHELDHLNGVLFVDRADQFYRPVKEDEQDEGSSV